MHAIEQDEYTLSAIEIEQDNTEIKTRIPFYACTHDDKLSKFTDITKRIWNMYSKIGIVLEIEFPLMDDEPNEWFDKHHSKTKIVGSNIIGPLVQSICSDLIKKKVLLKDKFRIALLGDSTVAYCIQYENANNVYRESWEDVNYNLKLLNYYINTYLNEHINKRDNKITFEFYYYCASGSALDNNEIGFIEQLKCCMNDDARQHFNAILMIGGWNNKLFNKAVTNDILQFKNLLKLSVENTDDKNTDDKNTDDKNTDDKNTDVETIRTNIIKNMFPEMNETNLLQIQYPLNNNENSNIEANKPIKYKLSDDEIKNDNKTIDEIIIESCVGPTLIIPFCACKYGDDNIYSK